MENVQRYIDVLIEIDRNDAIEVTDWEAEFLESNLRRSGHVAFSLTSKQRVIIRRMAETYLGDARATELLGQERLFV